MHKPLLVLMILGRAIAGGDNTFVFAEVAPTLEKLIERFGPRTKRTNAALPFWHLKGDGFWKVELSAEPAGRVTRMALLDGDAKGRVIPEAWHELISDQELARRVARRLLVKHWDSEQRRQVAEALALAPL